MTTPSCITVQYGSVTCKFVLPSTGAALEDLIKREFMLGSQVQVGLTVPNVASSQKMPGLEGIQDSRENDVAASRDVIVPLDIPVLKELPPENVFTVRVYPSAKDSIHSGESPVQVIAQYDFKGQNESELSFSAGDVIVLEYQYSKDWAKGHLAAKPAESGFFPSNYVFGLPPFSDNGPEVATLSNCNFQDDEYFEGYANLNIHLEMLQDKSRTLAYKKAVELASGFIKGRIVLDIGCGSGVLSIFCANAGAAHVYAVDASSVIEHARIVVNENDLSDRITLLKGKIEDITLPVEKVDVIISEWMGTLLICESMIASVLSARQRYLAPGGLMMPNIGNIRLAPIDISDFYDSKIAFWDDVYGIKMSGLKAKAMSDFFSKPIFDRIIQPGECLADDVVTQTVDMTTADVESLERMRSSFSFSIAKSGTLHGFGGWFDCQFQADPKSKTPFVLLSTSPFDTPTHWRQVTFVLANPLAVSEGDIVQGHIEIRRQAFWRRHFEVELTFKVGEEREETTQVFPLWR
ncbi:SH3 domain-containing protein [Plasmodiophora brassicae]